MTRRRATPPPGEPPAPPASDDEGAPLAVPDASTDVRQLIYLLEWARLRGFRMGPTIQVGDLIVQVSDLRQTEGRRGAEGERGPWVEAGYEGE